MGQFKEQSIDEIPPETTLPRELRAVITILAADPELVRKALPHVDIDRQEINWDDIYANDFGGGHSAALLWVLNWPFTGPYQINRMSPDFRRDSDGSDRLGDLMWCLRKRVWNLSGLLLRAPLLFGLLS